VILCCNAGPRGLSHYVSENCFSYKVSDCKLLCNAKFWLSVTSFLRATLLLKDFLEVFSSSLSSHTPRHNKTTMARGIVANSHSKVSCLKTKLIFTVVCQNIREKVLCPHSVHFHCFRFCLLQKEKSNTISRGTTPTNNSNRQQQQATATI